MYFLYDLPLIVFHFFSCSLVLKLYCYKLVPTMYDLPQRNFTIMNVRIYYFLTTSHECYCPCTHSTFLNYSRFSTLIDELCK
jgi:hypothetical protein